MPFTLTMPKLSPTMEEGTLVKWHKQPGDKIEMGDLLMEVATDKATVEFNALESGWMRKILVSEGTDVIVNQPVAILSVEKEESIEGYKPEGFNVEKSTIPKEDVAEVEKTETVAEKRSEEVPSATRGTLKTPHFIPEPPLEEEVFTSPKGFIKEKSFASPLARKLAQEKGLDLSTVTGTGPNGRIMSRDLEKAQPKGLVTFGHREKPQFKAGDYELESLSQMRKVIAQRLQESKTFIPHFYVSQTVNVGPLVEIRDQLRNGGIKVTYNDFVIKACALALKDYPNVNSGFDSLHQALIKFKTIDIAVAVSITQGLITPIIRYADFKNLGEISVEVRSLTKRAKEGKLQTHEYKGGSFTISNLGMYGVTDFAAILNPPQAAILAVSAIQNVPVVRQNTVEPGKVMNMTLSVDHRVIDGVLAAAFIKTIQKHLENPAYLLL